MSLSWYFLIAYFIVCIVLAYYGFKRKKNTLEDFFVGNRNFGKFLAFMTFSATLFSSFTFVGMPGFFYTHGIGSWLFIAFADIFMALIIGIFGFRIWSLGKKFRYVTPTEFLKDRFDSRPVMLIAGLISIVFLLPYISTQLVGASLMLAQLGIPLLAGSVIIALIILIYSEFGGIRTIAWTDALQGSLFLIIGILIAALFLGSGVGRGFFFRIYEINPALLSVPGPKGLFTIPMLISFFIMIIFMPATQPQLAMRFFLPKSKKVIKTMMIASPIFAFFAMLPTMIIGLGAHIINNNLASGDMALPAVLSVLPGILVSLALVAVIASSMSTVDSQLLALGGIITKDFAINTGLRNSKKRGNKKNAQFNKRRVNIARISMFSIMAAAFLISINPPKLIVTLSILSFAGTLQILPTIVGALFWKRATKQGALSSMIIGVIILSLSQWLGWKPWFGFHGAIWGLLGGSIALIAISLLTEKNSRKSKRSSEIINFLKKEFWMF